MSYESNGFTGLTKAQEDLVQYWQSGRAGYALPKREDIDPGAMREHLAAISIIEVEHSGAVRFRLAGSGLRSILGREMRGRCVSELDQTVSDMWSLGLTSALERGSPVGGIIERDKDQHAWLRLPLQSGNKGAIILCHDTLLPKKRHSDTPSDIISTTLSTKFSSLAA